MNAFKKLKEFDDKYKPILLDEKRFLNCLMIIDKKNRSLRHDLIELRKKYSESTTIN